MTKDSVTTYQPFPGSATTPSLGQFVDSVVNQKSAPPVGATPEQVREHFSKQAAVVELPPASGQTAAEFQNSTVPVFHAESEGVAVDLPSKFVFYNFKELYVHPFRGKHLAKLARAAKEKNVRILAEVMSSVLSVPGTQIGGLAFRLTLPDWYWLLYFQRRNCYTKVSFSHKFRCNNPKHIQEVLDGKLSPDTLINRTTIDTTQLEITEYEPIEIEQDLLDIGAHSPTVGDFVLSVEDPRFGDDEEYEWAAQIACLIYPDLPWDKRIEAVDELEASTIERLLEFERAVTSFGVKEKATVTCKECGASTGTTLSIDASSFLPSA